MTTDGAVDLSVKKIISNVNNEWFMKRCGLWLILEHFVRTYDSRGWPKVEIMYTFNGRIAVFICSYVTRFVLHWKWYSLREAITISDWCTVQKRVQFFKRGMYYTRLLAIELISTFNPLWNSRNKTVFRSNIFHVSIGAGNEYQ